MNENNKPINLFNGPKMVRHTLKIFFRFKKFLKVYVVILKRYALKTED